MQAYKQNQEFQFSIILVRFPVLTELTDVY
jgi:hypothetical protein